MDLNKGWLWWAVASLVAANWLITLISQGFLAFNQQKLVVCLVNSNSIWVFGKTNTTNLCYSTSHSEILLTLLKNRAKLLKSDREKFRELAGKFYCTLYIRLIFLSNRQISVIINGNSSNSETIKEAIPEVSARDTTIFLLLINDFSSAISA